MSDTDIIPIACDITKLDVAARAREQELLAWFRSAHRNAEWTGGAYRFTFDGDETTRASLDHFIALERLCCPFLAMTVEARADDTIVSMSGREGVREFIEATFARG